MNKQELDKAISFIDNPKGELQIIFYAIIKDQKEPKKLDIEEDALPELKTLFVNSIKNTIIEEEEYVVLPLSTADERGKCFYQYDLELPPELELLEQVIGNDNLQNFNFNSDELENIDSLIIVLADNKKELSLFKKLTPVEIIGRGGFIFKRASQRFERLDEKLLRISPKFQALSINKEVIIVNLKTIEKSFGFHDVIKREAVNSLSAINQMNILSNIDSLESLVDNISFARKLTKVAKSSPVIKLNIPNESIIDFAKSYPLTKKKIKLTEDGKKFFLDTRVSKDLFIKILNDDLLTSELTKLYYASLAKDGIEVEEQQNTENQ